jgi:hypothetical protein
MHELQVKMLLILLQTISCFQHKSTKHNQFVISARITAFTNHQACMHITLSITSNSHSVAILESLTYPLWPHFTTPLTGQERSEHSKDRDMEQFDREENELKNRMIDKT